tara:strand:- start:358 stop:663 length:306 start_codon:yes stop_codon:yes gene_type:complete
MTDKKTDYEHQTVDTEGLYEEEHEGKLTLFTPELLARDFAYIANWNPLDRLAHIGNALKYAQIGYDLNMIKILDDLKEDPEELDRLRKSIDDRLNSKKEIN